MRYTILWLGILLVLPGRAAEAQADIGATAMRLRAAAELRHLGQPAQADELHRVAFAGEPARDYRWEGLAIGAVCSGWPGPCCCTAPVRPTRRAPARPWVGSCWGQSSEV